MTEGATPGARRIAHALAEAVARQGRSTEQLAEALGLPRKALEARLRGEAPFGLDEIERLAAELGMGVGLVAVRSGDEPPTATGDA